MKKLFLALALTVSCGGCALTTATIDVPYQSASGTPTPTPGAANTLITVDATDARTTYRDRVSTKKNGYGMEMAAIIAANDIPSTVKAAFMQELAARGFRTGPGGATARVELVRFYNDFKIGFFSGDAVANVGFTVKVLTPDGGIAFSKYYEGNGTEPNILLAGGDNARAGLIKAFTAAVNNAVSDPDLIRAIVAAGGAVRQPPRAVRHGA